MSVAEFRQLAVDLSSAGARAVGPIRAAMKQAGDQTADLWRANATATAGQHGKHYPASISAELAFGVSMIAVDVGPELGKPQGGMSFEFGSRNQPPHLDGQKAVDASQGAVEAAVTSALSQVLS